MTLSTDLQKLDNEVKTITYYLQLYIRNGNADYTAVYYQGMALINTTCADDECKLAATDYLTKAILNCAKDDLQGTEKGLTISHYLKGFKLALKTGIHIDRLYNNLAEFE